MSNSANQTDATCEAACFVCDLLHVQLFHGGTRGNESDTAAAITTSFFFFF